MKRGPPTPEELDAIPVSAEEEQSYRDRIAKLQQTFDQTRIPRRIDWAFAMLCTSATICSLQGMTSEYWMKIAATCYEHAMTQPHDGAFPAAVPVVETPVGTMVRTVAQTVQLGGVRLSEPDTAMALVHMSASVFWRKHHVPLVLWLVAASQAFELTDQKLAEYVRTKGATA